MRDLGFLAVKEKYGGNNVEINRNIGEGVLKPILRLQSIGGQSFFCCEQTFFWF
ncbi:MAG: hypothetical protein ACXIUD_18615 [Mongoliitalea sp.]